MDCTQPTSQAVANWAIRQAKQPGSWRSLARTSWIPRYAGNGRA